jgi:undecaprenol kinase
MISFRAFLKSMKHAWRGICDVAIAEQSFRIQLLISIPVIGCIIVLPLQVWERILVILLLVSVLVLEMLNSILERLADAVHPRLHPTVREIKDMMAGAVLLAALTAAGIGIVIILPHIVNVFCERLESAFFENWVCMVK